MSVSLCLVLFIPYYREYGILHTHTYRAKILHGDLHNWFASIFIFFRTSSFNRMMKMTLVPYVISRTKSSLSLVWKDGRASSSWVVAGEP